MTATFTTTETWSCTHARYIAGKVGADLRQMQQAYGQPTDEHLSDLVAELTAYLADDYLDYVEYGFRRGDTWVVAHKYTAGELGAAANDDRSGRVRRGANVSGAYWSSYLVKNGRWWSLSQAERDRYESQIAIKRTPGTDATPASGGWATERSYAAGGGSISRSGCGPN
ncbi:MAG: hypothetical protein PVJ57_03635 [Phycisphaerae bacterium]|jgi:hypothetical protein